MKKYNLNGRKVELNETTIIIEEDGIVLHPDRMTIDVHIMYEGTERNDTDFITEVPVLNMNFEPASLIIQTMKALEKLET